jgi:hypothetical protein
MGPAREAQHFRVPAGIVRPLSATARGLAWGPALKNLSRPKVESGPIAGLAPQPYLWICCHNLKARQARVPSGSSPSSSAGPQASIQLFLWVAARTRAPQAAQATSSCALAAGDG